MAQFIFSNNVQTTLADAIVSSGQTTITLASTLNVPVVPPGYYWAITLNDAATQSVFEICYVTAVAGSVLTVLRGQEGTTAQTWLVGDYVYGAVTAGELTSFIQSSTASFVILSPGSYQSGFLDLLATSGEYSTLLGNNSSYGIIIGNATNGPAVRFDADGIPGIAWVEANGTYFIGGSDTYYGTSAIALAFTSNISSGSPAFVWNNYPSGTTALFTSAVTVAGVESAALGIEKVGVLDLLALDNSGNLGIAGSLSAVTEVQAPEIVQGSNQVLDTLTSTGGSITITGSGHTRNLEQSSTLQVGSTKIAEGNGGDPSIALPSAGTWWLELLYGAVQTNNANFSVTLAVIAGTVSSFGTNANGHGAFNAQNVLLMYAVGSAIGGQTVTFQLTVTGAAFAGTPYTPWTIRATRTA